MVKPAQNDKARLHTEPPSKPTSYWREYPYLDHPYYRSDGTVDGEKLLEMIKRAPGGLRPLFLSEETTLTAKSWKLLDDVIGKIIDLVVHYNHEAATYGNRLTAVRNLVCDYIYDTPPALIQKVANVKTSAALARGWELRLIMQKLASLVEPAGKGRSYDLPWQTPIKFLKEAPIGEKISTTWGLSTGSQVLPFKPLPFVHTSRSWKTKGWWRVSTRGF